MSRRYLLFGVSLFVLPAYAQASLCEQVPDCAALGFTTGYEDGCAENGYLVCPFDSNYRKCVTHSCEKMGFTTTDKSGWCGNIITCESDSSYTLCAEVNCFDLGYTSDDKSDWCSEIVTCPYDSDVTLCGRLKTCDDYPHESCPEAANCESCSIGTAASKYKIVSCKTGYKYSQYKWGTYYPGGICEAKTCYDYGLYPLGGRGCNRRSYQRLGANSDYCYSDCKDCPDPCDNEEARSVVCVYGEWTGRLYDSSKRDYYTYGTCTYYDYKGYTETACYAAEREYIVEWLSCEE